MVERRQWVSDNGYEWDTWSHMFETPPERMLLTLAYLDEQFGGAEGYLVDHGLAPADLARLRDLLTEAAERPSRDAERSTGAWPDARGAVAGRGRGRAHRRHRGWLGEATGPGCLRG